MFRGYVLTKNKKCLQAFKDVPDEQLLTLEQAEKFLEYAGIIANDAILIDVDDYAESEILWRIVEGEGLLCRVYETRRGKHFFFKNVDRAVPNQKIGGHLAVGLTADVKPGCVNTYSILKFDGKDREILYDILDGEEYQELPVWLRPLSRKSSISLKELGDGDGRNDALFRYIQVLERNNFTKEEIRETLRIVNKYVFKNPLSESELETIGRDESFGSTGTGEAGGGRERFQHDVFARQIVENNYIKRINGRLHIYRDGIYVDSSTEIERAMIQSVPNLTRAKRLEVLTYVNLLVGDNDQRTGAEYIAFKNGVLNIHTSEFMDFSPEYTITNKIDWPYNPNAESELVDRVLDQISCNSRQLRDLMEEMVGYCFYRRNELRKSFILVGDKANGKSTLLDMICTLLGEVNVSALDLAELDSQYKTAEIFGRLANIGDDIGDHFIKNPAMFKKLVSGDRVSARKIYEGPFDFSNYAKFLFSANEIPRIRDRTGAVLDRLIIIPFRATFDKNSGTYDPYIKYKLRAPECMEYLIQLGVKALQRVLLQNGFTVCEDVKAELNEYELSNNPILNFFAELDLEADIIGIPTREVFLRYEVWCTENAVQKMSNIEFSKIVKKHFGVVIADKRVGGKKKRVFVKK